MRDTSVDVHIPRKFWFSFFSGKYAPFELRNLAKIKLTTEKVCQNNFSETTQQNLVKLCSLCRCSYMQEILIRFIFWEIYPFWTWTLVRISYIILWISFKFIVKVYTVYMYIFKGNSYLIFFLSERTWISLGKNILFCASWMKSV